MTEDRFTLLRLVEAILFATAEPVTPAALAQRLPEGADVAGLIAELKGLYANRGVHLVEIEGRYAFRTAPDLGPRLQIEREVSRKLSRAAIETLAIIAYHQPVTRAEIEEIRGVATSKGTLDLLLETGWIRMRGRRRAPGRPVTYGTTEAFLTHFGLDTVGDLPGLDELKGAGLLDSRISAGFSIPEPHAGDELTEDEDPLEEDEFRAELAETDEPGG